LWHVEIEREGHFGMIIYLCLSRAHDTQQSKSRLCFYFFAPEQQQETLFFSA